jgi:peptide/nickel transport system permease protein
MSSTSLSFSELRPVSNAPTRAQTANSFLVRARRALLRNPPAVLGGVLLLVVIGAALAAPVIAPHDPTEQDTEHRLAPPAWDAAGLAAYPLGTDQVGRDLLSRALYGARVSLALGLSCTVLSSLIGVALGLLAGLGPPRVGEIIMGVADVQIAFPFLVLAIALIAVVGPSFGSLVAILSVFGWVQFARLVRGDVLAERERDYVLAARTVGATPLRVALRHVLPNVLSPVMVIWTFTLAQIILIESALSFLGLGVQPPTPSWGSMLADGRNYLDSAWWLGTFPGLAIMLSVLAVNLVGDALRDALDPHA